MAKVDSRAALLDAAAEEFAQRGPRGTRVHEIVARAGVNERMIYHHFGNKDGLYRAAFAQQWQMLAAAWQPALAAAAGLAPRAGMAHAFEGLSRVLRAHPRVLRLALHESMSGWQLAPRAQFDQIPDPIRTLYRRGQRDGVFRADCPIELVYLAALGAVMAFDVIGGRFSDLRAQLARANRGFELTDRAIALVLDGAMLPVPAPSKPSESKPSESKPSESKPSLPKPSLSKPSPLKPSKPSESKPKPSESKPVPRAARRKRRRAPAVSPAVPVRHAARGARDA